MFKGYYEKMKSFQKSYLSGNLSKEKKIRRTNMIMNHVKHFYRMKKNVINFISIKNLDTMKDIFEFFLNCSSLLHLSQLLDFIPTKIK